MRVEILNPNYLHQFWPTVEPMLSRAMEHVKGEITLSQLKAYVSDGTYQLILFIDDENAVIGSVVVEFNNLPNDRIMFVVAIGGKTNKKCTEEMFQYAKSQGATAVRGAAHKSAARLWHMKYGFETIYYTVEKRFA